MVLVYNSYSTKGRVSQAEALVLSEINDGDNEKVEISGNYVNDRFKLLSLKANGYQVGF